MNAKKLKELKKQANLALAKKDFFHYCHVMAPDFYKYNRKYLVDMANTMQNFYESEEDDILIINIPPRTGKSRTATMFAQWIFGKNPNEKIMTGSYNETLSTMFAKGVRNAIAEQKADENKVVYSDIFPNTRIKHGDASMSLWSLEGGYNNYLATSPGGTATGFGATCFVGDTEVATTKGNVKIKDIYEKNDIQVLSWCHKSGKVTKGNIKAFRRKESNETFVITTESGKSIECTGDHLVYIEGEGYKRADKLQVGDKTKALQRELRYMQRTDERKREEMSGLLRQREKERSIDGVFELQKDISNTSVCKEQANIERDNGNFLQHILFESTQSKRTKNEKMLVMRGLFSKRKEVLFSKLQRHAKKEECRREEEKSVRVLHEVQQGIREKTQDSSILFCGLREFSSFVKNDWRKQFKLQRRSKLQCRFQENENDGIREGFENLSELRRKRREKSDETVFECDEPTCTPYRRKQTKQCYGEFDNALSQLPYLSTQEEEITSIEKVVKEVFVYDIQVEKYENFFANGILVHNCLIIDDLIKNAKEAFNARVLEDQFSWFTNTMLSRLEEGGKIIVIMTRWSSKDLAGRLLEYFAEEGKKVVHINMKAMQDDGTMLCEEVLSKESYLMKTKAMSHEIAMANYQQEPIDVKGRLYTTLKTYSGELPRFKEIKNVTDTADTGADYLCSINYGVTFDDEAYILDVLYTQEGMEVTEPKHAKMLFEGNVNVSDIESNNGGRGYARNVERILKTTYGTNRVIIKPFHQSGNKESRILSTSSWVMEHVYFPEGWRNKWPDFYKSMMEYQKNGKNAHDDAQDALALLAEKINSKPKFESW